jgi:hypothetical protein
MRIYIKSGKVRFLLPIPNAFLKFGVSCINKPFIQKRIPEKDKKYVNLIDFNKLSSCIDLLKEYRGLRIVDVNAKDGTRVSITL